MVILTPKVHQIFKISLGFLSGAVFTVIVGSLDTTSYLVEQLSIGLVEVPFIVFCAVCERKYGWRNFLLYVFLGTFASILLTFSEKSITPVIFLKASLMGMILGEITWFERSFIQRLSAVSFPGIMFAFVFGVPLVIKGVPPEVMERIRQDALDIYQTFMSNDEAITAADNAMRMFKGFFMVGFAVFIISALIFSWLSFLGAKWIMVKFREEQEYVAPLQSFKLPFHAIWMFLGGSGILIIGYEPVFQLALNVFVIMAFFYLIQGVAIVMYQMNKFSMGHFPRVIFWLLFFITLSFTSIFLILAGITDNWFNLRSLSLNQDANSK